MRRWGWVYGLLAGCSFGGGGPTEPSLNSVGDGDSTAAITSGIGESTTVMAPGDATTPSDDTTTASPTTAGADAETLTGDPAEGSTTGPPMLEGLVEADLLVRYFLDEQPSERPRDGAEIFDYGPGVPVDLMTLVVNNQPYYQQDALNTGLSWDNPNNTGRAIAPVLGTKLANLNGATELTIEFVASVASLAQMGSRFVHVGADSSQHSFAVAARPNQLEFRSAQSNEQAVWEGLALSPARAVYILVVDLNRKRDPYLLFVNGTPFQPTATAPQQAQISLNPDHFLSLGNRDDGSRALGGTLYYAALYSRALSLTEILHDTELLSQDDDQQ
ncbi:MAG: LamG-like jellyroll fold domain-containing protein [Myxococcota bacterium]